MNETARAVDVAPTFDACLLWCACVNQRLPLPRLIDTYDVWFPKELSPALQQTEIMGHEGSHTIMARRTGIPLQSVVAVQFSELFGKQPTLEDASRVLQNYQRTSVLVMLGKLSAVLKTWQVRPNFAADRDLAAQVFLGAGRSEFQRATEDA